MAPYGDIILSLVVVYCAVGALLPPPVVPSIGGIDGRLVLAGVFTLVVLAVSTFHFASKKKEQQQEREEKEKSADPMSCTKEEEQQQEEAEEESTKPDTKKEAEKPKPTATPKGAKKATPKKDVRKLTPQEIWYLADKNQDGSLSKTELKLALTSSEEVQVFLGLEENDTHALKLLFDEIDTDGSGSISKTEFLAKFDPESIAPADIPPANTKALEEAQKIFDLADLNDDGNLSQKELIAFIESNQDSLLSDYFASPSSSKKKKKVHEFCKEISEIDGVTSTADGSYHVSKEDFCAAYRNKIAEKVAAAGDAEPVEVAAKIEEDM